VHPRQRATPYPPQRGEVGVKLDAQLIKQIAVLRVLRRRVEVAQWPLPRRRERWRRGGRGGGWGGCGGCGGGGFGGGGGGGRLRLNLHLRNHAGVAPRGGVRSERGPQRYEARRVSRGVTDLRVRCACGARAARERRACGAHVMCMH
jgi:hypothetical protein